MTSERIGLIGQGRMGLAMVKHLIKAGYQVTNPPDGAGAGFTIRALTHFHGGYAAVDEQILPPDER